MLRELARRYETIATLGQGGTGTVYRVRDRAAPSGPELALKVLDRGAATRLAAHEFRFLASHDHPGLVRVIDYGVAGEIPYFTMELCEGPDLLTWALRELPPPPETREDPRFLDILRQLLDSLEYLHTRGILHHDLKPTNLLVTGPPDQPRTKLIDFGLAGRSGVGGKTGGTLEYMAPERLREEPATPRSDLYSLGVCLCEIAGGFLPFRGERAGEIIDAHLQGRRQLGALPAELATLVERLLDRDPLGRPPSARAVFEVLAPEAEAPRFAPPFASVLAGREELLETLERRLPRGEAGVAVLHGPTGSGKSRLLRELRLGFQLEGRLIVSAEGRETDEVPGAVLRRVLRQLQFDTSGGGQTTELLLGELAGGSLPDGRDARELREALAHRFAASVIDTTRERASTILVDDAHRLDSLSLEGLLALSRTLARSEGTLSLALAFSDDEARYRDALRPFAELAEPSTEDLITSAVPEAERPERLLVAKLEGLSADELRRYLTVLLGGEHFPAELPTRLHEASGGNPFRVVEFLRRLARGGELESSSEGWRLESLDELTIPESLEQHARLHIEGQSPQVLELLRQAAIVGEAFSIAEIHGLLTREAPQAWTLDTVRGTITSAALDDVLQREGTHYLFSHAALRQVVLEDLEADQRARLHRNVAERLELEQEVDPGRLAEHWYHSDVPERSRPWLAEAAHRARATGSLREAELHLSRSLEVSPAATDRWTILLEREEVRGQLGETSLREEDLAALAELAVDREAPADHAELALREALYLDNRGSRREALARIAEARELPELDEKSRARLLSREGMIHIFLADYSASESSLGESLALARTRRDRFQEAEALGLLGLSGYFRGDYESASRDLRAALALRRALGDEYRAGSLESNLGLLQLDRGLFEAAKERFQSALDVYRHLGHRRGEAISLLNLGLVEAEMGRLERALDHMTRALAVRRSLADRHGEGTDIGNIGGVWLKIGLPERARPAVEQSLAIAREVGNRASSVTNLTRLALIAHEASEEKKAWRACEEAFAIAEDSGSRALRASVRVVRSTILNARGEADAALQSAREGIALAEEEGLRPRLIETLLAASEAALALGDLALAEQSSRRAIDELQNLASWIELSHRAWYLRYRVLEAARKEAREHDDPALALSRAYSLLREKADHFRDPELRSAYLESITTHAEIVREHAELQRRIREQADLHEQSFYEIARSIHSVRELDPLLERLLRIAIESTHADKGLILLENDKGTLKTHAAHGMPRQSIEDASEICQSVIRDVAGGGGPVLASDALQDDRFRERQSIISFEIRTLMCVPLELRSRVLGAVYVDGRGSATFTSEDLRYLVSFAQLAAIAVDNAQLLERLRHENQELRRAVDPRAGATIVAESPAMRDLLELVDKIGRSDAGVLIEGETGTGKTLIAGSLHRASQRGEGSFVTVDCGALPESLLESELFGHKSGAFSGALYDRTGLIEEADGGTLFLDEITNTSLDLQAKLLRVLQEGEIRRVGENETRQVNVRFIAATNEDIRQAVEDGLFREDLFYRLNVISIRMPALRERREDIPILAQHFLRQSTERLGRPPFEVARAALELLYESPWSGNIRELQNLMEKAVILADDPVLTREFLAKLLDEQMMPASAPAGTLPSDTDQGPVLHLEDFDRRWKEAERNYLEDLVERSDWNLSAAARLAGVKNRNTFISRLKKHGIERPE